MIRTSFLQDITEEDCGEDVETPETWRADWFFFILLVDGQSHGHLPGKQPQFAMENGPVEIVDLS
jgi:hypothetical protein